MPSPQLTGRPFAVTVTALDAFEQPVTNYSGTPTFRARLSNSSTLPGTGRFLSNFVAGVWQGLVTISNAYPSVRITVDDLSEHLGVSADFAVIQGYSLHAAIVGEDVELSFGTVRAWRYALEWTDRLDGSWRSLGSSQPGTGEEVRITDLGAARLPRRFYRLAIQP